MFVKIQRVSVATILLLLPAVVLFSSVVFAGDLTQRKIVITSARAGATNDHLISYMYNDSNVIGSLVFEYCTNSGVLGADCSAPIGLDMTGASLAFQSGETGFAISPLSTANKIVLSRAAIAVSPGFAQYLFEDAVNNTSVNETVYVRISSHASGDGTGAALDNGSVAYSTSSEISTSLYVPPYLLFCVGVTVELDCSDATGSLIELGELETALANLATSQYSGATNDPTGYNVSVIGTTLTSGNNEIPALLNPTGSSPGVSQFGINLRANNNPVVGIESFGPGTSTITSRYANQNQFTFKSGDVISQVSSTTSYKRFTVSYLTNISDAQPAGIYSATFSYIATASF